MTKPWIVTVIVLCCLSFLMGKELFPERQIIEIISPVEIVKTIEVPVDTEELDRIARESAKTIQHLKEELIIGTESFNILKSKTEGIQQEVIQRDVYMAGISFLWDPRKQAYVEDVLSFKDIQNIKNALFHQSIDN